MSTGSSVSGEAQSASAVIERQVQKRIFKIIVIGDSNVGKTCLTFRFCGGKFPEKTEATIGVDFREKTVEINKEYVKLQLWDTAGQERFRKSMVQHYYRNVHAVVFVYDVTKVSSFENLPHWIEECNRHRLTCDIPRILVGNKCDMKERVAVSTTMAQKFADIHSMPLFETSAKDNHKANHVDAIFMTLAHKLMSAKPMMLPFNNENGVMYNSESKVVSVGSSGRHGSSSSEHEDSTCACTI